MSKTDPAHYPVDQLPGRTYQIPERVKLFTSAFLQVFLVACSTVFIARQNYPLAICASWGISWFWSGNVKRVAFGGVWDRVIYATGASAGSVCGMFIAYSL